MFRSLFLLTFCALVATALMWDHRAPASPMVDPKFSYDASCDIISEGEAELRVEGRAGVAFHTILETHDMADFADLTATGATMSGTVLDNQSCNDGNDPPIGCSQRWTSAGCIASTRWNVVATVDDITVTLTTDVNPVVEVAKGGTPRGGIPAALEAEAYWEIQDAADHRFILTLPFTRGNHATTKIKIVTDTLARTHTAGNFEDELGTVWWQIVIDEDGDCVVDAGEDLLYPTATNWVELEQDGAGTTNGPTPLINLATGEHDYILVVKYWTDNRALASILTDCGGNDAEDPRLDDEVFTLVIEPRS